MAWAGAGRDASAVRRNLVNWPAWLLISTPVKFWLWLTNRLLTWSGLWYLWRRFRRRRRFWLWAALLNALSLGTLSLLFLWVHRIRP